MADRSEPLKFGIFAQPFHQPGEHPTVAYERDMEVIELLDRLNFDEAWIGEHHSAGWETVGDPALFIAAAAQRTRHIRFGTGVVSLPYHHPFTLAHRMVQLDHLTRGRINFGVGPGALYSDAYQLGIEPTTQRRRMGEALDAIMRLLRGEVVTEQTEWYELRDARLQMASYQQPHVPVFVAHAVSPAGAQAAGRHGLGMLSVASSELAGGLGTMSQAWTWASEEAALHGTEVDRRDWRITMTMHLADSREEALEDIREGVLALNHGYFGTLGIRFEGGRDSVDWLANQPGVAIGTPDDATAAIEEVLEASGGVGGILINHREWARTTGRMRRSYELFARHVMPRFQGQAQPFEDSLEWAREGHRTLFRPVRAAQRQAFVDAGIEVPDALRPRGRTPEPDG